MIKWDGRKFEFVSLRVFSQLLSYIQNLNFISFEPIEKLFILLYVKNVISNKSNPMSNLNLVWKIMNLYGIFTKIWLFHLRQ